MKWRILILMIFALLVTVAFGQSDNMIHVKAFPGTNVGQKTANAMFTCPSAPVPCILVVDASLAAAPAGIMPALCSNCSLKDYRQGESGNYPGVSSDGNMGLKIAGKLAVGTTSPNLFHGLVPPTAPFGSSFVFKGDSLTYGAGLSAGENISSQAALQTFFAGHGTITNLGISGEQVTTMRAAYATEIKSYCQASTTAHPTYLWFEGGINDTYCGSGGGCRSGATTLANLKSYWAQAKSDGCLLIVTTLTPMGLTDGTAQENERKTINAGIRAASNLYDYLIDLDVMFPDDADTYFYQSDKTHYQAAADKLIAQFLASVLGNGAISGSGSSSTTCAGNGTIRILTANYTLQASDCGNVVFMTGTGLTLTLPNTLGSNAGPYQIENGASATAVTGQASGTIPSLIPAYAGLTINNGGTGYPMNWFVSGSIGITSASNQPTTTVNGATETVTGLYVGLEAGFPSIAPYVSGAPTDQKHADSYYDGTSWHWRWINDAQNNANDFLVCTRSGFTPVNCMINGGLKLPSIKATTGTRYVCVDTNGALVSQTTACSGT